MLSAAHYSLFELSHTEKGMKCAFSVKHHSPKHDIDCMQNKSALHTTVVHAYQANDSKTTKVGGCPTS